VGLGGVAELHAAFLKESLMKFVERTKANRKSGGYGAPKIRWYRKILR
jgi:hypothetical protein